MSSLYDLALTVPWCITDDALEAMLSIASRDPLPSDEIARRMHGPLALAMRDGTRRDDSQAMTMRDGVACIPINGPIYRYADFFSQVSGGTTTEALAKDFQTALDDPLTKAILFVIDSPGGEAIGINELADTIYAARGTKPIGAYIEGYGASAAYWLASACDMVTCDDNALVGSIGTVMGVPDPSKQPSRTINFVSSQSPKKRVDPTTQSGKAYLQTMVDDMTEVFVARVMRNRALTRDQVLAAEGGLRIGQQAVDAGLADRLGSEEQVIADLRAQAQSKNMPMMPMPNKKPMRGMGMMRQQEDTRMKISELFGGFLRAAKQEGIEIEPDEPAAQIEQAAAQTAQPPAAPAPDATMAREVEALKAQLAAQRTQQTQASAAAFADGAIRDRRALPSERQALYDAYLLAADDDQAHGQATFSDGTEGTRVSRLEALVTSRPQHDLFVEQIRTNEAGALSSGGQAQMSEERRAALLAMTPEGQAVLRRRREQRDRRA